MIKISSKYILIIGLILAFCSCKNKDNKRTNTDNNDIKDVLTLLLDESNVKELSKSTCANFMDELNDTTFYKIVRVLKKNSFMDSAESNHKLIEQDKRFQGVKIGCYIDTSKYVYERLDINSKYGYSQLHIIFTPPIFFDNGKKCFIYEQDWFTKQQKLFQAFFLYEKINNKWVNIDVGVLTLTLPPIMHSDIGSYILKKYWITDRSTVKTE